VFPDLLPRPAENYTAFGFLYESDTPLPIGFSVRRQIIDRSAINCAACHTGSVRASPESDPILITGMPANTVDLLGFFRFLFATAADARFNPDTLIAAMEEDEALGRFERLVYRFAVPAMRQGLLERSSKLAFILDPEYPAFGPGRVDTFDTFKFDQFAEIYDRHGIEPIAAELYGVVSFPSIWNQSAREGLSLHWDGNNSSVRERNFSASIGAGAQPYEVDVPSLNRIAEWLQELPAPTYPFEVDEALASKGRDVYEAYCYECHDFDGARVGTVIPLEKIGTDRSRLDSYTDFLRRAQIEYTSDVDWTFEHFRKTDGYATQPLDGIWARAPYLHNDSVPTMWDLLKPEDERPVQFGLGNDVVDPEKLGFVSDTANARFVFDTRKRANHNTGHTGYAYGPDLSTDDKRALIEYMKTH
jgi:mono/diheme cytochrome c family protein